MARYALAALPGIAFWAIFLIRPSLPPWLLTAVAWLVAAAPVVACYLLGSCGPRWVRWSVAAVDLSAVVGLIVLLRPVAQFSH